MHNKTENPLPFFTVKIASLQSVNCMTNKTTSLRPVAETVLALTP